MSLNLKGSKVLKKSLNLKGLKVLKKRFNLKGSKASKKWYFDKFIHFLSTLGP